MVDAVGNEFGRQQGDPLGAGVTVSEHLPHERPCGADLLRFTADDQAVPGVQVSDRALPRRTITSRDVGDRSRHSPSFELGADTDLENVQHRI
ncbi:MAG: hypothetical protein ACRDOU_16970 [Streptosporangiaceae bacterium]